MRIAMFTDAYAPRINGVAISVESFANSLCKLGHSVCIVCPDYQTVQPMSNKVRVEENTCALYPTLLRVPSNSIPWSKKDRVARLDNWNSIKTYLDFFEVDIVHINSEFFIGWYGLMYARHRHIAVTFTFHTLWEDYFENYLTAFPVWFSKKLGKEFVKFYLKRSDGVIVPTLRIALVAKQYGLTESPDILPTGIPDNLYSIDEEKISFHQKQILKEFPLLENKKVLLYVGRIVNEKNLDFLFEVFKIVYEKNKETVLFFVGGGPALVSLKEKSQKYDFRNNVLFSGYRNRDELVYFYHIAHVFVFPSLTETQGLVTIEAMLSKLPVVAIGEMGTVDVMQGDNGGFMVKNNPCEFAERVLDLISDSELHCKKSEEAFEWGKQWSMNVLAPRLIDFYQKAIMRRKRRSGK